MSFYDGLSHLQHPVEITNINWTYAVLGVSFIFEGVSFAVGMRKLLAQNPDQSLRRAITSSKDPRVFTVVFEDAADLLGLITALAGVVLAQLLADPRFDGYASLLIGLTLAAVALFLVFQTRSLLLGESAEPEMRDGIHGLVANSAGVTRVRQMLTMHLGPSDVLLALTLDFRPGLSAADVAAEVDRLEHAIQSKYPSVKHLFVEVESISGVAGRSTGSASSSNQPAEQRGHTPR